MAEASNQAVGSPPPRQSARLGLPQGTTKSVKKANRAATPWPKRRGAPEEEDAEDQAVLDIAKSTGLLPCVVFKGTVSTKCNLIIGGPPKARYTIGQGRAVSATELIKEYGPNGKGQYDSVFVLSETDTGVKAHDLKRGKSKSLGSWMSKHADKMEAIRVAFSEPKASDSPRKEASLAETTKKAVHTKKAKGKSRNAAAEETANKRASGESIAVKGGQTEAVVVQETRGGRRGGKRVGEEPLASGWPSNGEPTKKPRTGNTAASAVPELVSAVEQPAGVFAGALPTLTSKQFLSLTPEMQRTYAMSQAYMAGMHLLNHPPPPAKK